ncbi:SsgA family sporulation/cell division regulator [Saccharopolyspora phatthalungensis]|uniref:Sporulation protein SsgA n=1 Tax=Saccharopolyspora phatthalungensis TaxID=664693 RepID=A0A840PX56_9PSEU|nr:SsgA family sporulation/cell division regulator [Saccharopolyspora phatthalungensis]MBB5152494.1 hypothetical protein [Saccharopolyspora phatthalungensis]
MIAHDHRTVRTDMVFSLVAAEGAVAPVAVQLRYDSRNPYEVCLSFNAGKSGRVDWVFGRDLLTDGLVVNSGEGDVRIGPRLDAPALVNISLRSPSGQATFEADAERLMKFVNETYELVAPGAEHQWMSVDEALVRLLPHDL